MCHHLARVVLGVKPRIFCILGKLSTNQARSPVPPSPLAFIFICLNGVQRKFVPVLWYSLLPICPHLVKRHIACMYKSLLFEYG